MAWISVVDWRRFQHYDPAKRVPPWIKNYTELLDDDEYLRLTSRQRGLLHGIWLLYAASRCKLSDSPALLTRRLGLGPTTAERGLSEGSAAAQGGLDEGSSEAARRLASGAGVVRRRDLDALVRAGFIRIVASKELAKGYQGASETLASRAPARSLETETETETEPYKAIVSVSSNDRIPRTPPADSAVEAPPPASVFQRDASGDDQYHAALRWLRDERGFAEEDWELTCTERFEVLEEDMDALRYEQGRLVERELAS
jgi:hypothetical protein